IVFLEGNYASSHFFFCSQCHGLHLSFFSHDDAPQDRNHPHQNNEKEDHRDSRSIADSHVVNALMHHIPHYGRCCVLWAALSHDLHLRIEFKCYDSGCDQHENSGIAQKGESDVAELLPPSSTINPCSFVKRLWNPLQTCQEDYHLETDSLPNRQQ